jgi:signal transduction histidine kinase
MKSNTPSSIRHVADSLESKLKVLADRAILDRSLVTIPLYFFLFLAIVFATPLSYRYPRGTFLFGAFSLFLCLIRLWIFKTWKVLFAKQSGPWRGLFLWTYYLTSVSWGIFCCLTVVFLELGWTSFFVLLITLGISAASVPTLAPKYSLSKWHLGFMFFPSLVAAVFFVGGLKGYALGSFFTGFFLLLLLQAKVQNIEYWQALRNQARLQAMVDSLPGTLSWITSDLVYLGVNQQLARLWNMPQDFFVGKKMGFSKPRSSIRSMIEELFKSNHDQQSKEIELDINGTDRTYYVVASKYHRNTEAVILGIDVTEYKKAFVELAKRRDQVQSAFRQALLGKIALCLSQNHQTPRYVEILNYLSLENKDTAPTTVVLHEFCDDLRTVYEVWTKDKKVPIKIAPINKDLTLFCRAGRIFESTLHLVINAYEAVAEQPNAWILLEAKKQAFGVELAVTDSGDGILPETKEKIFQPFFTTKDPTKHPGLGLSTTRETVENHGGLLVYDAASANTRFIISLAEKTGSGVDWINSGT